MKTPPAAPDPCCDPDLPHTQNDTKHVLVLIDRNEAHREQVRAALMSLYNIVEFEDPEKALTHLRYAKVGLVLVGEGAPPKDGREIVRRIRSFRSLRNLPVLLFLDSLLDASEADACGANGWLSKPYMRSDLINLISAQMNASVEKQWEALPELEARALKGTVEAFNSLSDIIDKGEPIVYTQMSEACSPLVEAVNSDSFKGILSGVREHDNYTYAHSLRVAVFLALFGRAIGLPPKQQKLLATGGLLHDVGKMFIPHLVLNKPGKLTQEEFAVMKGHVNASISVLEKGNIPKGVITIAAQHHEKLDGSGYPLGLKGAELNELARMASIVDVFSALTDRRVYKAPMAPEKALQIMTEEMPGHLDLGLLAKFRDMLLDAAVD